MENLGQLLAVTLSRRKFLAVGAAGAGALLGGPRLARAQRKEVVVGGIYPLTGPNAATGVELKQGYELGLDIINSRYDLDLPLARSEGLPNLGGAKLKIIFADHQNKPDVAQAEAERLITQEKVVALVGCYISGVTAPASQVAERHGIPFVDPDAIAPTLVKRGFKYFFRITQDTEIWFRDHMWSRFIPEVEKKRGIKVRGIASVHENTLWGMDTAKYGLDFAKQRGYTVLADIAYPARTTSVAAEVQKLKQYEAQTDLLLQASYVNDGILFIRSFKELNYNPPMIYNDGGYREPAFLQALGKDAEYICQRDEFSLDMAGKRPIIKQVNDLYRKRFNADMNTNSSRTFMCAIVVADAINRAGSVDPEAIRRALLDTKIPARQTITAWEGVEFDPSNGQNKLVQSVILQVHGGVWRAVWPFDIASQELVWPMPKWSERK